MVKITNCSLETRPNYRCVICTKSIHRGDSGCICSTFRPRDFLYASICVKCAASYDKLINSEEFMPIVKVLLEIKYLEGVGPVNDF